MTKFDDFYVCYSPTLTNARMLTVRGNTITIEDKPPEKGGKPLSERESRLVRRIGELKGWDEFFIEQQEGFAWRKRGNVFWLYLDKLNVA